ADGAGSRVRKAAGFDMVGPDNIQTYINVHFKANLRELVSGREGILYWVMDEALTGTFIAHDIDSNWIFMKAVDADEPIDSIDEDKFATLLKASIGADVPIEIQSMNAWRMTAQISSGYRAGGIFLVGDAAHRFPPTGGIGMNTGFQDAHNLVWKLGMVERGMAPEILATYEPERKPIAQTNSDQSLHNALKMIEVAVALDVDGDQRITAGDIDAVLADPERLAAVQTAVDAQAEHFNLSGLDLGLCYTGAAVLEDGPPPVSDNPASNYLPSTTPGARLPHATLLKDGEPISTLDLVPYDHLLILSQGDRHPGLDAAVETLRGEGVPVHLEMFGSGTAAPPTDDAAFAALFPADELLLVRPDGHIAGRFRGDNAAQEACRACAGLWSP
ncbi:MAG: FAD-dependent monooxygenase, partial [Pseudomonadota bacterium]